MRAAIYARYSSDLQSAASIEDQVRLWRELAKREGHEVVEVYSDYAISGGSLRNRPGMLTLMDTARVGGFDLVVADALDRVSRDQEDVAGIFKRLSHADVALVTLAEGVINELHVGLKGTMNALFLKDLSEKTRRGQRGRVEAGLSPGGNSYGYRVVRHIGEDGEVARGKREIDPEEAGVVRRIFDAYAAGVSPRMIAAQLNGEEIPSPRGGLGNASTINGSRQRRNGSLNNELYLGRFIYNRQHFVKDPDTGKRVSRLNPESQWVTSEVPSLRIIDDETWNAVQVIKDRYSSQRGNKRQSKNRLLSGLVRCGTCGGAMTIVNRERYSCSGKRERGTCDNPTGISAAEFEQRVLDGLRDILLERDDLLEEFAVAFKAEVNRLRRSRIRDESAKRRELAKVVRGIERCLAFIGDGDGDPGVVREKLAVLEARKRSLSYDLDLSGQPSDGEIHPNTAELYRRKVGELGALLADENACPEAIEIIRSLIDRIEVSPGEQRGTPDVLLVGALASILEYAAVPKKRNAASVGGDLGRVLMVAGAGFEPATFRL